MSEVLFHSGGILKPIAMLTAYMDESGTHQGSKIFIVAAYVGVSKEWGSVELRFKKADKLSGRIFHAVDCANGGKDFRGIHKDKRYRLIKKMIKVVNDHDIMGVAFGAYIEDYEAVFPRNGDHWESWLEYLFKTLFEGVVIEIEKYTRQRYPGEKLSIVMEQSQHWYPAAYRAFLHLKSQQPYTEYLETIAPYSVKDARQLHAPDLLAYETYLLKLRERHPTKHGPREYMMDLLKKKKLGKEWDKEAFAFVKAIESASSHSEQESLLKAFRASRGL